MGPVGCVILWDGVMKGGGCILLLMSFAFCV